MVGHEGALPLRSELPIYSISLPMAVFVLHWKYESLNSSTNSINWLPPPTLIDTLQSFSCESQTHVATLHKMHELPHKPRGKLTAHVRCWLVIIIDPLSCHLVTVTAACSPKEDLAIC